MTKKEIIILLVVILIGGFFVFFRDNSARQNASVINQAEQPINAKSNWESKTDEQASVTVIITPIDIFSQSKEWKFEVAMNTHSVELDQDMIKIVILVDDQGKEYKPIAWEGPVGSHHREGVLIFNQITPIPKSIELKISGIGDVVRSFVW